MGWGDELIVTGQAREAQARDPRRVRIVYETRRWHEAWLNNPRIARMDESGDFQELRPRENYLRPYCVAKTPERWTWRAWGPPRGELYFSPGEAAFGAAYRDRIVIEPRIKPGASPNKDWGLQNWTELTKLARRAGIRFTQLAPIEKYRLPGVEWICTATMRMAAAVLEHARAAVLHEGAMHHACAAFGTPSVVIFGGYIAPAVTGYPDQASLFEGGAGHPLGCGMRVHCDHCIGAMAAITPERVFAEMEAMLETSRRRIPA